MRKDMVESAWISGKKTSMGLDENLAGALCYALGFITGIVFLVMEKDNKFVKFHAWQSIITFVTLTVVGWAITSVMFMSYSTMWIGGMLSLLLVLVEFILWLILILKAYQGEKFKLPIVGDFAEKQSQL